MEKNKKVSITDPINDEINGATNQTFFLNLSNTCTSSNCAVKKAIPDPIAILLILNLKSQ